MEDRAGLSRSHCQLSTGYGLLENVLHLTTLAIYFYCMMKGVGVGGARLLIILISWNELAMNCVDAREGLGGEGGPRAPSYIPVRRAGPSRGRREGPGGGGETAPSVSPGGRGATLLVRGQQQRPP